MITKSTPMRVVPRRAASKTPLGKMNDIKCCDTCKRKGVYKNGRGLLTGHATIMRLEVLVRVGTGIAELQRGRNDAAVLLVVAPAAGEFRKISTVHPYQVH